MSNPEKVSRFGNFELPRILFPDGVVIIAEGPRLPSFNEYSILFRAILGEQEIHEELGECPDTDVGAHWDFLQQRHVCFVSTLPGVKKLSLKPVVAFVHKDMGEKLGSSQSISDIIRRYSSLASFLSDLEQASKDFQRSIVNFFNIQQIANIGPAWLKLSSNERRSFAEDNRLKVLTAMLAQGPLFIIMSGELNPLGGLSKNAAQLFPLALIDDKTDRVGTQQTLSFIKQIVDESADRLEAIKRLVVAGWLPGETAIVNGRFVSKR